MSSWLDKLASWSTQPCSLCSHGFLPSACALISNLPLDYETDMLQSIKLGFLAHHAHLKVEHFTIRIYVSRPAQRPSKNYVERIAWSFIQWKQCFNVNSLIVYRASDVIGSRLGWSAKIKWPVDGDLSAKLRYISKWLDVGPDTSRCTSEQL